MTRPRYPLADTGLSQTYWYVRICWPIRGSVKLTTRRHICFRENHAEKDILPPLRTVRICVHKNVSTPEIQHRSGYTSDWCHTHNCTGKIKQQSRVSHHQDFLTDTSSASILRTTFFVTRPLVFSLLTPSSAIKVSKGRNKWVGRKFAHLAVPCRN